MPFHASHLAFKTRNFSKNGKFAVCWNYGQKIRAENHIQDLLAFEITEH